MKSIWKFPLSISRLQNIEMPLGAIVLTAQTQFGKPFLWAEIDSKNKKELRCFEVVGTGGEIPKDALNRIYINSFQLQEGALVYHLYEIRIINEPEIRFN